MKARAHLAEQLRCGIAAFEDSCGPLPGLRDAAARRVFVSQLLESMRRVEYIAMIQNRDISTRRADPNDDFFDPLRAAILSHRHGDAENAFWLVFLSVHFEKHSRGGWRYAREIYGRLGQPRHWDWEATSADPAAFRLWLKHHYAHLSRPGAGFGNHRKYESLKGSTSTGTGEVIESYVRWVSPAGTHRDLIDRHIALAATQGHTAFDTLYSSMRVARFGRTARFDYLTMIAKLGLAAISPEIPYLTGATGPLRGARLLFGERSSPRELDLRLVRLDDYLRVGMQVLEDALCNWQKSPTVFVPFRG